ncbi:MAG: hypothetical protein NZ873_01680 [Crenarchaeota archaeon]|nr:hypothetical protein [Thermoproteota archaeon]MDW8034106.1 hypothetical protein [Nitrososphaerota archaeon]
MGIVLYIISIYNNIAFSTIRVQLGFLIVLAIISVSLAWLAKVKVVNPLRRKELPKHIRAWYLALSILGLFFGMMIGLVVMGYAEEKIKLLLRHISQSDFPSTLTTINQLKQSYMFLL